MRGETHAAQGTFPNTGAAEALLAGGIGDIAGRMVASSRQATCPHSRPRDSGCGADSPKERTGRLSNRCVLRRACP
jgi:hypothetical protein